jgi:hypothetical protein
MANGIAALHQVLCDREKTIGDVKILMFTGCEQHGLTAFVVTMKGKTFGEVFEKTVAWFDKNAAMNQALSDSSTKSKAKS